jgi:hypothetical protein
MKKIILLTTLFAGIDAFSQTPSQKFEFVNFSQVNITDNFWKPKIDKVATGDNEGMHLSNRDKNSTHSQL